MAKNNVRKKPTAREMASAIIELNGRVGELYRVVKELDTVLGLYVESKGDKKTFNVYIEKKYQEFKEMKEKENDQKPNGEVNKQNLQGDTDGESSGAERIRQESK